MTLHTPMARIPFAPLDHPRLQHLASAKNRQNGLVSHPSPLGKGSLTPSKSATKRSLEPSTFEDYDGENVDPTLFSSPSKKPKSEAAKPFAFSLTSSKNMPPPPPPNRLSTPVRANTSSARAPLTAPAGRSPKRKIASISKNRRISAPFTRIDPPFMTSRSSSSSLPFSLDAALAGLSSAGKAKQVNEASTIQESMPKSWFFDIYEDTPEEEASTLMEHSTLTLDLGSDEESRKNNRDDRGKENVAPEGYDAPTASRSVVELAVAVPMAVKKTDIVRKKKVTDEMDDGERSPLSDLETASFVPEGMHPDAHIIVEATPKKDVVKELSTASAPPTASPFAREANKRSRDRPVIDTKGDRNGDVLIWEDGPASHEPGTTIETTTTNVFAPAKYGEERIDDENTAPTV